jgi:hypothetical protein
VIAHDLKDSPFVELAEECGSNSAVERLIRRHRTPLRAIFALCADHARFQTSVCLVKRQIRFRELRAEFV